MSLPTSLLTLAGLAAAATLLNAAPIVPAKLNRTTKVDYGKEIAPMLKANCTACHNKTTTKGGLNMETPELMKKGGDSGTAIEPGKGSASLLVQSAAHTSDSDMPPKGNKVGAENLTPQELALLSLWIDQGAQAGAKSERKIDWQPLSSSLCSIYAVAMSPGGEWVACSRANQVFVYDLATKKQIARFEAHRDMALALAFSPDGSRLASGSFGEVKLWKVSTPPAPLPVLVKLRRAAGLAALDTSYRTSAVAEADKEVVIVKDRVAKAGTAIADTKKRLEEKRAAVKPTSDATAAAQKAHSEAAAALAKQPKDKPDAALAKKETDAKAKLDAASKAEADAKDALKTAETAATDAAAELPKVTQLQTAAIKAAADAKAALAKAQADQKIADAALATATKAAAAGATKAPAPSASTAASKAPAPPAAVAAAKTPAPPVNKVTPVTTVPPTPANAPAPEWKLERTLGTGDTSSPIHDRVNALAFSPDGKLLAAGSGEPSRGGDITLWSLASGKLTNAFTDRHSDSVLSLEFSPDGKLIASGGADKQLRVSDLASGKLLKTFEGHTHHVLGVAWRADGRVLSSSGADNVVKVWDWLKLDRRKSLDGWDREVTSAHYIGATTRLATTAGDKQVRLLGEDGSAPAALPGTTDFMQACSLTHDGDLLAAGGEDGTLRVWDIKTAKEQASFPAP